MNRGAAAEAFRLLADEIEHRPSQSIEACLRVVAEKLEQLDQDDRDFDDSVHNDSMR